MGNKLDQALSLIPFLFRVMHISEFRQLFCIYMCVSVSIVVGDSS